MVFPTIYVRHGARSSKLAVDVPSHNHIARATSWTDPQHTDPLEPGKALRKSLQVPLPNDLVDTVRVNDPVM